MVLPNEIRRAQGCRYLTDKTTLTSRCDQPAPYVVSLVSAPELGGDEWPACPDHAKEMYEGVRRFVGPAATLRKWVEVTFTKWTTEVANPDELGPQ